MVLDRKGGFGVFQLYRYESPPTQIPFIFESGASSNEIQLESDLKPKCDEPSSERPVGTRGDEQEKMGVTSSSGGVMGATGKELVEETEGTRLQGEEMEGTGNMGG